MSMSNWTVEGYGIDSEVLNDTNFGDYRVLAKKFAELHPEEIGNYMGQSLFLWDLTHDPTNVYAGRHPCLNPEGMLDSI